jgi:catechol 2,3-dioxygenase-like lactoylglutathione lyase family enzyme
MITNLSLLSVWVKDIDESLAFYTDVLGFEVGDDLQLGPDFRWTTVFHPKQPEIHLHLSTPSGPLPDYLIEAMNRAQDEGGLPGVGMNVDDCRATYEDQGRGVPAGAGGAPVRRRGADARQLRQLDGAGREARLHP